MASKYKQLIENIKQNNFSISTDLIGSMNLDERRELLSRLAQNSAVKTRTGAVVIEVTFSTAGYPTKAIAHANGQSLPVWAEDVWDGKARRARELAEQFPADPELSNKRRRDEIYSCSRAAAEGGGTFGGTTCQYTTQAVCAILPGSGYLADLSQVADRVRTRFLQAFAHAVTWCSPANVGIGDLPGSLLLD